MLPRRAALQAVFQSAEAPGRCAAERWKGASREGEARSTADGGRKIEAVGRGNYFDE